MKKWKIGCIGVLVVVGLLAWGLSRLDVVVPISRLVLIETPGGSIPMRLVIFDKDDAYIIPGDSSLGREGILRTSDGAIIITKLDRKNGFTEIEFSTYDSVLRLDGFYFPRSESGPTGTWAKNRGDKGIAVLKAAVPSAVNSSWYTPVETDLMRVDFDGRWSVKFDSSDDLAIGEFTIWNRKDETKTGLASGTFLTTTGDYRYLAGRVDGNLMRLSTFDGAHAFLFHARMQADGSIEGDFWSGNWHHETWTAVRDDDAKLPDAFEQTVITDEEALAEAVFKDLEGEPTRVLDVLDESYAKARIIEIFGTWCPNCSDAGRELVSLKEQYGDDLAIVGLAFEITEDFERSVEQVKRHHEHIGTSWPILIAGLSDKDKATVALGFLDQVRSYPTLVFLNEHNEVQAVYSGFSGPATGEAYTEQRLRFEALIDGMIED